MFVKLLGLIDILGAVSVVLLKYGLLNQFPLILIILLIVKGAFFLPNIVSIIDILCGVLIILSLFGYFNFFIWFVFIYLIIKGIYSLS